MLMIILGIIGSICMIVIDICLVISVRKLRIAKEYLYVIKRYIEEGHKEEYEPILGAIVLALEGDTKTSVYRDKETGETFNILGKKIRR